MAAVALYGLEVPPVGVLVPSQQEDSIPNVAYRITMAALDPTEAPEADEEGNIPDKPRATLKLVRQRAPDLDEELDDEYLEALMGGSDDDEEDSDEDDEVNGGPSDPSKSKKAKAEAALQKLIDAAQAEESDDEMADADSKSNGKPKKGKAPATSSDDEDDDSDDEDGIDLEEFVICTLDTERNYQQTIDIVIQPNEKVFFRVTGTHAIHLTGNYIIDGDEESEDDDEEDYDDDFPNQLEEMYGAGSDSEEDDLDGLEDPRITEVDSEEEEAPKLVKAKKGKNKRAAEEEAESLDALIAKADSVEDKTSKKQKKLKNNKGDAVEVEKKAESKESPKDAKKVQFAKNLEQGPTGSTAKTEKAATGGVKVVNGVTIDDRKIGKGRPAKNGNKVGVRYIGKLVDGKVFDSNKKGKPFTFSLGKGEVIKGWEIGLEGMQVGGERRVTIPPKLAYGSKSLPGIPGNSTLVFDVKLLEIK